MPPGSRKQPVTVGLLAAVPASPGTAAATIRHRSWLEWAGPSGSGRLALSGQRVSIGRRSTCSLFLDDSKVSRLHASLLREHGSWLLVDEQSANGTLLNGRPVHRQALRPGDIIQVGGTRLVFREAEADVAAVDITVVPAPDSKPPALACLSCEPGDFRPEAEITREEDLRADYRRLHTAYLFHAYLGRETDERKLLENILHFAFQQLPAERGAILLREEEGAPLVPALAMNRNGERTRMVIPDSVLRLAISSRRAVLSEDALLDTRFARAPSIVDEGVRSVMCVPLLGRQEAVGALHLDTRTTRGAFGERDLQMLSAIAAQAASVLEQSRLHRRLQRESLQRQRLSRFLPREVVREVVSRGLELDAGGRSCHVAVLFCDIRSFCSLAESLPAVELVQLLNTFFERMVEVVFDHGGMLDKFIGDALMAVWGAPLQKPDDSWRAICAGRQMLRELEAVNREITRAGWPQLSAGIGLHSGEAVVGTVGSRRRMEYTVMGATVNLASRICQLAGGGQLLASAQAVGEAAREGRQLPVRRLPTTRVRGMSRPVHLYQVDYQE